MVYRNSLRIVVDILTIAKNSDSEKGVGITTLLRKGNISYSRLSRLLKDLVKCGLIEEVNAERGMRYRISDQGRQFLVAYSRFEEFAQSFGLRL
ncbi:MAG: winged helix DNA-binding protein [Thaumarchaeota archaeon]|jgi:predicted transcriptional regulator|nr:winged helix DNA-binding protein [Nitrososphaerota archaeon]